MEKNIDSELEILCDNVIAINCKIQTKVGDNEKYKYCKELSNSIMDDLEKEVKKKIVSYWVHIHVLVREEIGEGFFQRFTNIPGNHYYSKLYKKNDMKISIGMLLIKKN